MGNLIVQSIPTENSRCIPQQLQALWGLCPDRGAAFREGFGDLVPGIPPGLMLGGLVA